MGMPIVWRQELSEESDYLIRSCRDEYFAERVEAERKQRPSAAAMFFDGNPSPIEVG